MGESSVGCLFFVVVCRICVGGCFWSFWDWRDVFVDLLLGGGVVFGLLYLLGYLCVCLCLRVGCGCCVGLGLCYCGFGFVLVVVKCVFVVAF